MLLNFSLTELRLPKYILCRCYTCSVSEQILSSYIRHDVSNITYYFFSAPAGVLLISLHFLSTVDTKNHFWAAAK